MYNMPHTAYTLQSGLGSFGFIFRELVRLIAKNIWWRNYSKQHVRPSTYRKVINEQKKIQKPKPEKHNQKINQKLMKN